MVTGSILPRGHDLDRPMCIAILAMGGQGGGVLANWIRALGEANGYVTQSTSVPGVAQRTGATIYYIEMIPKRDGRTPVLSLMPAPGEVDVVLAAEFMEAGRSMLRGLVTPDRTTLIASTHRAFAVIEKEQPGNGIADAQKVVAATQIAAKRTVAFDMQTLAENVKSVISSAMFGALAGAGVLPFARSSYEDVIHQSGRGVEASLKAFALAYKRAEEPEIAPEPEIVAAIRLPPATGNRRLDGLMSRIATFPPTLHKLIYAGVSKLVDFQDADYAADYLTQLEQIHALDRAAAGDRSDFAVTATTAKHLANAMAYDDPFRVADLKSRSARFQRVRSEIGAKSGDIIEITEFMHPRMEEVCGSLPASIGEWLERRPRLMRWCDARVNKGRRVATTRIGYFLLLHTVGRLRASRRGTLRHRREMAHVARWMALIRKHTQPNYAIAVEIAKARRLVKGYSDTHARGTSKYDRVLSAVPQLAERTDGAEWLARLVRIALKDEAASDLDGALKTIATF